MIFDGIFRFGLSWYWPVGAKHPTANAHYAHVTCRLTLSEITVFIAAPNTYTTRWSENVYLIERGEMLYR